MRLCSALWFSTARKREVKTSPSPPLADKLPDVCSRFGTGRFHPFMQPRHGQSSVRPNKVKIKHGLRRLQRGTGFPFPVAPSSSIHVGVQRQPAKAKAWHHGTPPDVPAEYGVQRQHSSRSLFRIEDCSASCVGMLWATRLPLASGSGVGGFRIAFEFLRPTQNKGPFPGQCQSLPEGGSLAESPSPSRVCWIGCAGCGRTPIDWLQGTRKIALL